MGGVGGVVFAVVVVVAVVAFVAVVLVAVVFVFEGGVGRVSLEGVEVELGSVDVSFCASTASVTPVGSKSSAFKEEIFALFTNVFSSFT